MHTRHLSSVNWLDRVNHVTLIRAVLSSCILSLSLVGCSNESEIEQSRLFPGIRVVPDPAMAQMQENAGASARSEIEITAVKQSNLPLPVPDSFTVDSENKRVFMPGKGWLEAAAFWDIYYNQPQLLPAEIDHASLEPLRNHSEGVN